MSQLHGRTLYRAQRMRSTNHLDDVSRSLPSGGWHQREGLELKQNKTKISGCANINLKYIIRKHRTTGPPAPELVAPQPDHQETPLTNQGAALTLIGGSGLTRHFTALWKPALTPAGLEVSKCICLAGEKDMRTLKSAHTTHPPPNPCCCHSAAAPDARSGWEDEK